ncbi:MAG TPA: hypothetical protein VLH77_01285 [Gammaproteobacteria bacterium]|nr:hypothetical protein [Gammaproteobacteria bacterium]
MLKKIKLLGTTLTFCALALPFTAQANLTIDNQTFFPSTCKINNQSGHAQCSNTIPVYGITQPHSKNIIPQGIIWGACLANLHACTAEVYMTNNCTGPVIATAVFDISSGIKTINNLYGEEGFMLANPPRSPFYIDIMGGPAALINS